MDRTKTKKLLFQLIVVVVCVAPFLTVYLHTKSINDRSLELICTYLLNNDCAHFIYLYLSLAHTKTSNARFRFVFLSHSKLASLSINGKIEKKRRAIPLDRPHASTAKYTISFNTNVAQQCGWKLGHTLLLATFQLRSSLSIAITNYR